MPSNSPSVSQGEVGVGSTFGFSIVSGEDRLNSGGRERSERVLLPRCQSQLQTYCAKYSRQSSKRWISLSGGKGTIHRFPLNACVLVQPEMEKRRSPLVSIPPFGRGFSRHGAFRSDGGWAAQERVLTAPFIVSMSPPGYPSAWLRPRSARFRFARQNRCNSATSCRFSTSGLPLTPPEPRPARPES